MLQWSDRGFVLAARRHGEHNLIVTVLTLDHGRHLGLVRGGAGRRAGGLYQLGNELALGWRARLSEHLGTFTCESLVARAALVLNDPLRLSGLASLCAMIDAAAPERAPYPQLYERSTALLEAIVANGPWLEDYVRWEIFLLQVLGYGLDLGAAAGPNAGPVVISTTTARARRQAPGTVPLPDHVVLPGFLHGGGGAQPGEVLAGLRLSGIFLGRNLLHGVPLPAARARLIEKLRRGSH